MSSQILMSPERKAKELFNSGGLTPLATYLEEWRAQKHDHDSFYMQEVCAAYFRIMTGVTRP